MLIDEILQQINNARSTQGKTPLTMDDLLGILSKDRASFERGGLTKNDENILLKLRDDEIESSIKNTPVWIKIIWLLIFVLVVKFLYGLIF